MGGFLLVTYDMQHLVFSLKTWLGVTFRSQPSEYYARGGDYGI